MGTTTVGERNPADPPAAPSVMRTVRYRRTLRAAKPQAFDAVVHAVELLRYPGAEADPLGAAIRFRALARTVRVRVVDRDAGLCRIVLQFEAPRWMAIGGSAPVILPGALLGAAIRAHDRWFAHRFLDNVRRVLEGGPVRWDPARLPGMGSLREKLGLSEPPAGTR